MDKQILEILAGVAFLFIAAGLWLKRRNAAFIAPVTQDMPLEDAKDYRLAHSLFVNAPERAFYSSLVRAFENSPASKALVLTKVRLEDIVRVGPHVKERRRVWQLRGRVKSRHVDYLICAPDGRPLMAIELDGASHKGKAAAPADRLKDAIFAACGLEFRRVKTGEDFARAAASIAFFVANILKSPQQKKNSAKSRLF